MNNEHTMTNEEAIRVLEQIKKHPSMQVYLPDEYEALDLAIEVLEREALVEKMTKAYYKELRGEANNDKVD